MRPPIPTSAELHLLADALERLEKARQYLAGITHTKPAVSVTWTFGSRDTGFAEVQQTVQRLVDDRLPELLKDAEAVLRRKVLEDAEACGFPLSPEDL